MPAPSAAGGLAGHGGPSELRAFSPAQLRVLLRAKLRKRRAAERRHHLTRDLTGADHAHRL